MDSSNSEQGEGAAAAPLRAEQKRAAAFILRFVAQRMGDMVPRLVASDGLESVAQVFFARFENRRRATFTAQLTVSDRCCERS
jgi:hypothetical protein